MRQTAAERGWSPSRDAKPLVQPRSLLRNRLSRKYGENRGSLVVFCGAPFPFPDLQLQQQFRVSVRQCGGGGALAGREVAPVAQDDTQGVGAGPQILRDVAGDVQAAPMVIGQAR